MSRIGQMPIPVPQGVVLDIGEDAVSVKGPKGELSRPLNPEMAITLNDNILVVSRPSDSMVHRSMHGLTRSLLANMVEGVSAGFEKGLEIVGVGYRAEKTGEKSRGYLTGLVDLTLLCDGGTGMDLVGVAMSAGAAGATIARLKHVRPPDSPLSEVSPAREACSMIVSNSHVNGILDALKEGGAFTDSCHGQIQLRQVPKAFTYLVK